MTRCDLHLENYIGKYVDGQTIVGYLECVLDEDLTVKGIKLEFKGEASTNWTETESHYNSTTKTNESRTIYYHAEEQIFYNKIYLLNTANSEVTLKKGEHKYPFSFLLPKGIPPSYDAGTGKIVYTVKGTMKRPLMRFDYTCQAELQIMSYLDLNLNHMLLEPVNIHKKKDVCCFCISSGNIKFEAHVPFTGFVPGQKVPIHVYIENMANLNVEYLKFKIRKTEEFITHTPHRKSRTSTIDVAKKQFSGVGAHGDRTYDETIEIPESYCIPNLTQCSIINNTFTLLIEAGLPMMHSNIKANIDIVFGHIPLRGVNSLLPQTLPCYGEVAAAINIDYPDSNDESGPSHGYPATAPSYDQDTIGWQMPTALADNSLINFAAALPPTYEEATSMMKKGA